MIVIKQCHSVFYSQHAPGRYCRPTNDDETNIMDILKFVLQDLLHLPTKVNFIHYYKK